MHSCMGKVAFSSTIPRLRVFELCLPVLMTHRRVWSRILFVCLSALVGIALSARAQTTAPNEWTWMGGSNSVTSANGQPGVYGTLGMAATTNIPGGRDSAATWSDTSGNFWLFGGEGVDANGNFGGLNDLWEFNPSTNQWNWMGGSSAVPSSCAGSTTIPCGQPGVYGVLGAAAATNIPGARTGAASWSDSSGNFWLFGGYGLGADQNIGELNDLWEFNPTTKEWTWVGGSDTVGSNAGQPGMYGIFGSAAVSNIPGGRDSAATWTDNNGNFWLFGGEGMDANGDFAQLDDMWEFDPSTSEWTWVGGSSTLPAACAMTTTAHCGWPTAYGVLGVASPGIGPGSRVAPATWKDKDGNFWLFGGLDTIFSGSSDFGWVDQYDLWEFSPSTNQWAWVGGNNTTGCGESTSEQWCGQNGMYGMQGVPAIVNIPPSRNSAVTWTDAAGNFWLLGGNQLTTTDSGGICNDLWVFEPTANEWAWMGGNAQISIYSCEDITTGTYGVLGSPGPSNLPSGRVGGASWTDSSGNLWLFGGLGYATGNVLPFSAVDLNDLWVYQASAPSPQPSFEVIASPNPINIDANGAGSSTTTTGTTTVNVVGADGFASPVTLSAATDTCNGITCITGSFSPSTTTGAGSSTLTISVTGSAVLIPGPIPLTVIATSGSISQSTQVIVDVTKIGTIVAPTFSVPTGTYAAPLTVDLSDSYLTDYNNMFIYYTTDGTTPTATSSVYVSPITMSSTTTLRAIAIDPFFDQSAVSSATYTIAPATPAPNFMPGGGTYSSPQSVTLTDSIPGATIYYSAGGSTPTTSSTIYSGPITVSSSETLEAIASANGYASSIVATATYDLPIPGFSIAGTAVSVAPGAITGNTSAITLAPSNGFTGVVSLSCAITPVATSAPATCSIPASVTIIGSTPQTVTLTVNTTSASLALNGTRSLFRPLMDVSALACILLVGIPVRRRGWWTMFGMLVLVFFVVAGAIGCGGGGNAGSGENGGGANPGTTPGSYTVTVTGTSGNITQKGTVSLTVQ